MFRLEMAVDRDPNIVRSGLSTTVAKDGLSVDVEIYRLEDEPRWVLEVVDNTGASTVGDDQFETDESALAAFQAVFADEGIQAFTERKVIPFPKRP
jgi:hypothetical protein